MSNADNKNLIVGCAVAGIIAGIAILYQQDKLPNEVKNSVCFCPFAKCLCNASNKHNILCFPCQLSVLRRAQQAKAVKTLKWHDCPWPRSDLWLRPGALQSKSSQFNNTTTTAV
jgi:hypothetical protein